MLHRSFPKKYVRRRSFPAAGFLFVLEVCFKLH